MPKVKEQILEKMPHQELIMLIPHFLFTSTIMKLHVNGVTSRIRLCGVPLVYRDNKREKEEIGEGILPTEAGSCNTMFLLNTDSVILTPTQCETNAS